MSTNNQSDAAIVNLKGTNTALALKVDCNARYVNADPDKVVPSQFLKRQEILFVPEENLLQLQTV